MNNDKNSSGEWKEVAEFQRRADEAHDLFSRMPGIYPIKRDIAALRARHESGDRNVRKTNHGEDIGITYDLEFTEEQKAELKQAYLAARPSRPGVGGFVPDHDFDASVFVGVLGRWGDGLLDYPSMAPDSQKGRIRTLDSVSVAVSKLDQALAGLDSAAMGHWYAHVVDALAPLGIQMSPADDSMISMTDHPVRAMVEGGELRSDLRTVITAIVAATSKAAGTLPKHNHVESNPCLSKAKALERLIIENQIPFSSSETGFAAICLRAIFSLGGLDVEKVSYWLKKAEDDPDSFAKFLQRMRGE